MSNSENWLDGKCAKHPYRKLVTICKSCNKTYCDLCGSYQRKLCDKCRNRNIFIISILCLIFTAVIVGNIIELDFTNRNKPVHTQEKTNETSNDELCDRVNILKRCNDLIINDSPRACLKLSDQFFENCGDYDQLHAYRIIAANRLSDWKISLESANKLIDMYPENPDIWLKRADTFEGKGDLDKAINDFKQVLALMPDEINTPFRLANLYTRLKRPCEGIAPLAQFISLHPEIAEGASRQLENLFRNPTCSPLKGSGKADIPVQRRGNAIISTAMINNNLSGKFVIDTGASMVTLTQKFAKSIGLDYSNWPERLTQTDPHHE